MSLPRKYKVACAMLFATAVFGGLYVFNRHESRSATQSTDDAYVRADYSMVAPQVAGVLADVLVEDNEIVRRGQLLAVIDDRDYRVAVAAATARLAEAKAAAAALEASITQQGSLISQAQAAMNADEANVSLARANQTRYRNLSSDGSGTIQEREQADAQLRIHEASQRRDAAALQATQQQLAILRANFKKALAEVDGASAALNAADLKLSYTRIVAPIDGTVGQRELRVGNFVTPGQPLVALVPMDRLYVEAKFRETQLQYIRDGQAVSILVDTLPGVELKGHVQSVAPATGVTFASLAPDNATGNFTKVVQRLSVKVSVDQGQPQAQRLRVGMSVRPTVRIKSV